MLATMPKKKPKPGSELKHPNVVLVRLDDEEVEALRAYMDAQEVKPERPAVLVVALRRLLIERGFLKTRSWGA
jgi:hypothetical protein